VRRRLTRFGVIVAIGALAGGVTAAPATLAAGTDQTYLIVYQAKAVPSDAASRITAAGGTLVASYGAIGVAVARSSSATFKANVKSDSRVAAAAATGKTAVRVNDDQQANDSTAAPNTPATDGDSLSGLQWDMVQIHTPEAHAITGGDSSVLVGDIDTGIDFTHPDLTANIDVANSANCVSGAPVPGTAAQDDNGHGTHTAGTIAAASNGIGIVGVAPNVKIAGIKAGNADGYFFPEAVVCSFVWAATHGVDVTNNSYFADPYLYNCRNDPVQRAIWKAEQRAIRFAQQQGVTVVAAEGNQSDDLGHPTQDSTSPDDTTPEVRAIHNDCIVIPTEIPGVIGVTADGNRQQDPSGYLKSFYSSFGVASAQVVAPGGDSLFGQTAEAPNGRVLSTWPSFPCLRLVIDAGARYCYLQGTSMASPHVAGVAALIISQFGSSTSPQNGEMPPSQVAAYIDQTADPQPCPATLPAGYLDFVGVDDGQVQTCQGGLGYNSWYGHGQVNALGAVTHSP
jgi:subtilisin family serine protease